jgi:hypothetical protein
MHTRPLDAHPHDHSFGLDKPSPGQSRTLIAAIITAIFMVGVMQDMNDFSSALEKSMLWELLPEHSYLLASHC